MLAIGVIALESAVIDVGREEVGILLEAARGALAFEDFTEAERGFVNRRRAAGPSRLRRGPA